jgi:hypothetical protein
MALGGKMLETVPANGTAEVLAKLVPSFTCCAPDK